MSCCCCCLFVSRVVVVSEPNYYPAAASAAVRVVSFAAAPVDLVSVVFFVFCFFALVVSAVYSWALLFGCACCVFGVRFE